MRDATGGIEPPYQVLQTYAYPLGHMAIIVFSVYYGEFLMT
jgi:hypothetical protein